MLGGDMSAGSMRAAIIILLLLLALALLSHRDSRGHTDQSANRIPAPVPAFAPGISVTAQNFSTTSALPLRRYSIL
jgi:hypothetical protein